MLNSPAFPVELRESSMKSHTLLVAVAATAGAGTPLTQSAYADPIQQPASGQPASGQPVSGQPVSGQPVSGQPVSGQPASGQPAYVEQAYVVPGHSEPGYGSQNPVSKVIDQLLGEWYPPSDHQAVSVCASAALNQAAAKFRVNGYSGYSGGYTGYAGANRPGASRYPVNPGMRVTALTDVRRGGDGLRVKGLIDSGMTQGAFGARAYQGVGTGGQPYADRNPTANDLSFRCNVDPAGRITSLRVERNTTTYRRY